MIKILHFVRSRPCSGISICHQNNSCNTVFQNCVCLDYLLAWNVQDKSDKDKESEGCCSEQQKGKFVW